MAEQEACTELVDKASQDQTTTTYEGESQLLPLLQGLLEAPDTEQTADSGTESGEDQRSNLIAEVQNALDKLSTNLRDDANDITTERRNSLLQLVTKLQVGLAASIPKQTRRTSCQNHFRRKQKPNRHTIGVSSEELADARKLIEEISQEKHLQKQNSENQITKTFQEKKITVKNTTAKPFSSSNSTISGNSSTVQTPDGDTIEFLFNDENNEKEEINKKIETEDEDTIKEKSIIMQTNPLYQKFDEKPNKFNSKKLKMKRANTIDIPKPVNFYENDADSDCSLPDEDYQQRRRSNYLALRGPIRVGNTGNYKTNLPIFEPKTDNDKKFLEFINKHNETIKPNTKNSIWSKPETNHAKIWTNKFDNIKTQFEKSTKTNLSQNSARNFWKTNDSVINQKIFQEKLPNKSEKNIVSGTLKVRNYENEKFLPINKFSHAPQSAFKPIKKNLPEISKTPLKNQESPLFLYSPKPLNQTQTIKPWAINPSENRVLTLAASKFENPTTPEPIQIKPRKLSKEKIFGQFQQNINEKNKTLTRGQYNYNDKQNDYSTYTTIKYTSPINNQNEKFIKLYQPEFNSNQVYSAKTQQIFIPPTESNDFNYKKNSKKSQDLPHQNPTEVDSLKEYNAVNSRVMIGPISQQATTIHQKTPMNRNQHDMAAALNLRNTLQKISPKPDITNVKPEENKIPTNFNNTTISPTNVESPQNSFVENSTNNQEPPKIISPINYKSNSFNYSSTNQLSPHDFNYKNNDRGYESLEINDNGESIITSKFQIPLINIPNEESQLLTTYHNKNDSWNEINMKQQNQLLHKPSPRSSPNARNVTISKSKSSHSLVLPKQFEAGMSKDEMLLKRKTLEAFLTGNKSPQFSKTPSIDNLTKQEIKPKRSINRLKTNEKSIYNQSSGLSRSRTLPDIVCPQMLDETNVDKAFEELFKSST